MPAESPWTTAARTCTQQLPLANCYSFAIGQITPKTSFRRMRRCDHQSMSGESNNSERRPMSRDPLGWRSSQTWRHSRSTGDTHRFKLDQRARPFSQRSTTETWQAGEESVTCISQIKMSLRLQ